MKKIMFICHGNICRSPLAELIAKQIIDERNLSNRYEVVSKATSNEEIGNDLYPPVKQICRIHNIPYTRHYASRVKIEDYDNYDYFLCMDHYNISNLKFIFKQDDENKIHLLSEMAGFSGDVEDPWYTDNFEKVYREIKKYILAIFDNEII